MIRTRPWKPVLISLVALGATFAPAARATIYAPHTLVALGGDYEDQRVMQRLVELAGTDGRIVVLPLASSEPEVSGEAYRTYFRALGARHVEVVLAGDRQEAADPARVASVGAADVLFFTGGNQAQLADLLTGTALGGAVTAAWERGALIAGTSAGSMVWGAEMIAGGTGGGALTRAFEPDVAGAPGLDLEPGLGLLPDLLVDTRFSDQDRLGRLLLGVGISGTSLGVGVDGRTAAFITPSDVEALGPGAVTVVDPRGARLNNAPHAGPALPYGLAGFHYSRLVEGLTVSRPSGPPAAPAPDTLIGTGSVGPLLVAEPAATPSGSLPALRQLARAAGGAQGRVLILAGQQAYPDARAWQGALLRAGSRHAAIVVSADLSDAGLAAELSTSTAVLLVEDAQGDLLRVLDRDGGRMAALLADHVRREPLGAVGRAVRLLGVRAVFPVPGRTDRVPWTGLGLLPGAVVDEGAPEASALDRLFAAQAGLDRGVAIAPLPGASFTVARGQLVVTGGTVLVLQGGPDARFEVRGARPVGATGLLGSLVPVHGRFDLELGQARF